MAVANIKIATFHGWSQDCRAASEVLLNPVNSEESDVEKGYLDFDPERPPQVEVADDKQEWEICDIVGKEDIDGVLHYWVQ